MELKDKIIVVTGAASGIGKAMAIRYAAEGAKCVVCADMNGKGAAELAAAIGGVSHQLNVGVESEIKALIDKTESEQGPIDLFCSNAGISVAGGVDCTNEEWQTIWDVNVMSHVYAARACLPAMIERGDGYFLNTASAAGLLAQIGSAPYSVTKHAAVSFAESLAITHGDDGIKVSCLCPQAVDTAMTAGTEGGGVAGVDGMLSAEAVAEAVILGLEAESFLVLPHPEVEDYRQNKARSYDRWLGGMRKLRRLFTDPAGQ